MSGEVLAAIVGAAIGAFLALVGTHFQTTLNDKGKLEGYAVLLWMELSNLRIKLEGMSPDEAVPVLTLEVWKQVRVELATLLNDRDLFERICTIAFYVDEWNHTRRKQLLVSDLNHSHASMLTALGSVMPRLYDMGKLHKLEAARKAA